MTRHALPALLLTCFLSQALPAQQWAREMFETTRHDFGTIARGAKEEFRFNLNNIYREDVHISGVRSSCGCTIPRAEKETLKTYEDGAIVARINTLAFKGKRGATVTVTFDRPRYAQVQLDVSCYIRSDVVLHPGSAVFGAVEEGTGSEKTIAVDYAGRGDWQILDVTSKNPHLKGELVEKDRRGGRVSYDLTVRLDAEAPAGYLRDHLMLVTNDRRLRQVPLPVEAVVQPSVTVSPASLFMGVVRPGERVTKQLVVRGKTPFRIVSVNCDGEQFQFDTSADEAPKPVHLIPITFVAGEETGKILQRIRIQTDLDDSVPELSAHVLVSP